MKQSGIFLSSNIPDYRDDSISLYGILGKISYNILRYLNIKMYAMAKC